MRAMRDDMGQHVGNARADMEQHVGQCEGGHGGDAG